MKRETVPFGRPLRELTLTLLVIALSIWALTRPGLTGGLWVVTLVVLAIAAVCGLLAFIDSVRDRAPGERR